MSTKCNRSCVAVLMQSATPGTAQVLTARELAGVALDATIELFSPSNKSCEICLERPFNQTIDD